VPAFAALIHVLWNTARKSPSGFHRTRKGIRVEALVAELREVVTATMRELRALGFM
jgi:hypothetical protein